MSELKKIPVILDGDPGHDDAIGWTLAQGSGRFDILAVTSCSGNVGIEKTTYNTLRVCTLLGIDAPIAEGCPHPLTADVMNAPSVHGESGLDGPALPEPAMEVCSLTAVELMAKVLRESPEPVTIIPTGPETNVAALLLAHPELKCREQAEASGQNAVHAGDSYAVVRKGNPLVLRALHAVQHLPLGEHAPAAVQHKGKPAEVLGKSRAGAELGGNVRHAVGP